MRARLSSFWGFLLLLASACAPPPEEGSLDEKAWIQLQSVIMHDSLLFTFIQVFQIHVIKATATSGGAVTCDDFPSRYRTNDPRLSLVVEAINVSNKWNSPPTPATLNAITVPSDEKMLIVISGLAQTSKGPHTVARGCEDNLTFSSGTTNPVSIDVRATAGAPCLQQNECELTLVCRTSSTLPGGYCARVPCTGDASCPPGSRCVSDAESSSSMCARVCQTYKDCDTGNGHDCVGRLGPTGGGCALVCVNPLWNKGSACTP